MGLSLDTTCARVWVLAKIEVTMKIAYSVIRTHSLITLITGAMELMTAEMEPMKKIVPVDIAFFLVHAAKTNKVGLKIVNTITVT